MESYWGRLVVLHIRPLKVPHKESTCSVIFCFDEVFKVMTTPIDAFFEGNRTNDDTKKY